MDYNKVDRKAIKSWRIGGAIGLLITLLITIPAMFFLIKADWESIWKYILMGGVILGALYALVNFVIFPPIEYRQWGYLVEDDRVIIKHGIFFVKTVIVPVIRIQNITVSQGPINRALGLYKIRISLASGSFEIEGLNQETTEKISKNLKEKLYIRIAEKGVL